MQNDIRIEKTDLQTLIVQGGKITSLKNQIIQKSSARVYKNNSIYSAAFTGEISDSKILEMAEDKGNVGISYEYDLPKTEKIHSQSLITEQRSIGIKKFQDFIQDMGKVYPHFNWSGHAIFSKIQTEYKSSYSDTLKSEGEFFEVSLLYKQFGSTEFADGYIAESGQNYDFSKTLSKAEPLLSAFDKKANLDSNKMPVLILDSYDIYKTLSRDLKPDKIHNGSSFLSGKEGLQLFHRDLILMDKSFFPTDGKFIKFDGEAVKTQELKVFENGIFTEFPYDLRNAHKYGKKSTGHGFRNFNSGVTCSTGNLAITPGKTGMWEMLKSIPECLVVLMGFGGGINEEWNYSTPIQAGFVFKNGQPIGRIGGATIKGKLNQMLGEDLIGIASDCYANNSSPAILTQLDVFAH